MKHLRSTIGDIKRLLEQNLTAREISEPLVSFSRDEPASRARDYMKEKGFDIVGVRGEDGITGYVEIGDLEKQSLVGDAAKPIAVDEIIPENSPMSQALHQLETRDWIFISFLGVPTALITRADLQKAPVRMWLFSIVSIFEMQLLANIQSFDGDDSWWHGHLSEERLLKTKRFHEERERRNQSLHLSECLQFADKITIFKKTDSLLKKTQIASGNDWKNLGKDLENLRNDLAHSNKIGANGWSEVSKLAHQACEIIGNLEKG